MEIRKIEKNKPRIALLVDAWFPLFGGGQVHVAELARCLCENHNFEVDILTRNIKGHGSAFEKNLTNVDGLHVIRFGAPSAFSNPIMRIWYMFTCFVYLLTHGKKYSYLHSHSASSCIPMKLASWINGVPTIVTVHGSSLFNKSWSVKKFLEKILYLDTRYSKEISVSENFLKAKNVNKHISIVPNGVDLTRFDNIKAEPNNERFDALFVGRLDYVKGLDVLLNSLKIVIESSEFIQGGRDFMLHIVGDGGERRALEKQTEKLDLGRFVRFHGKVTGDALVSIYKSSDLFILPSRSEGLPLSLLEACVARLPIIATNVGDNAKLVIEKENGFLIAPDDEQELAYYLEHFVLNPGLKQMGLKGYELVANEFTWDRLTEKMLRIYEGISREDSLESKRSYEKFMSLLSDPRMPWRIPEILALKKMANSEYHGRLPLKFALTVDVEQAYGSADLPHEEDHIPVFIDRFAEMCESLEISSTFFVQADLLEPFANKFHELQASGHEIGIHGLHHELWGKRKWFLKDAWNSLPKRKKSLRIIKELISFLGLKDVIAFRAPNMVIDSSSLNLIKEAGFEIDSSAASMLGAKPLPSLKNGLCRVPVSRDPMPHIQWRFGLPFGNYKVMNLKNFLDMSDEELLVTVNRLREYHRLNNFHPHLVFLCHSWEFQTRDHLDYAKGENFSLFARKIAFLKDHMDLEFMTITDLCRNLYADS